MNQIIKNDNKTIKQQNQTKQTNKPLALCGVLCGQAFQQAAIEAERLVVQVRDYRALVHLEAAEK